MTHGFYLIIKKLQSTQKPNLIPNYKFIHMLLQALLPPAYYIILIAFFAVLGFSFIFYFLLYDVKLDIFEFFNYSVFQSITISLSEQAVNSRGYQNHSKQKQPIKTVVKFFKTTKK